MKLQIPIGKTVGLSSLAFCFCVQLISGQAVDNATPVHEVDGSFVREWLVLGPIPSKDMGIDFLAEAGGESNVRPKEGDSVVLKDGRRLTWTRIRSKTDWVELEQAFGFNEWSAAYAYCELNSDRSVESDVLAFAEAKLWLNGTEAGRTASNPGRSIDLPRGLPIRLNAGRNACLLKTALTQGPWRFMFQPLPAGRGKAEVHATDANGKLVAGAFVQFYEKGELVARGKTDGAGMVEACFYPLADTYDLRVTSGEMGTWLFEVALRPGERRRLEASLTNAVSISGQVLALDRSPQSAIVVQALRVAKNFTDPAGASRRDAPARTAEGGKGPDDRAPSPSPVAPLDATRTARRAVPTDEGKVRPLLPLPAFSESVLTDTNGNFRFVNLRPGPYQVRCHGPDGFVRLESGRGTNTTANVLVVEQGRPHQGLEFRFPEAKKGVWRNIPFTLGLREIRARSIHRTSDGLLWAGTDDATLHTFDGLEFKVIGGSEIPGNHVTFLSNDSAGGLWIGTSGGLRRKGDGPFQSYPYIDTLPRKQVTGVQQDRDGVIWCSTHSGLCRYDGGQWVKFDIHHGLPSNDVGSLLRARDGTLWLGTWSGLVRSDGRSFTLLEPFDGLSRREVGKLHQARDDAIWFQSYVSGACRFDGTNYFRLGVEDGLLDDNVRDIAETSDGTLWFATPRGISRFNGTTLVNYTDRDGLANSEVEDLFVDSDDVLWCAAMGSLSRFAPKGFTRFTQRDGLQNDEGTTAGVGDLERDPSGQIWVGTDWGEVYRTDGKTLQRIAPVEEVSLMVRQIRRAADGTLLFATQEGIFKVEADQLVRVLKANWLLAFHVDRDGSFWYGHGWQGGGMSRYNPKTGEHRTFTTGQGLPHSDVWTIEQSADGTIWIGTSGGLSRYRNGRIEDVRDVLGIPTGGVNRIWRDAEDTLWITGGRGLHLLGPAGSGNTEASGLQWPDFGPSEKTSHRSPVSPALAFEGRKRVSITAANGLPEEHLWCAARTGDGKIWMGSADNGLLGYDGKAVTVIDKRDGLTGNAPFCLLTNADNSLWVGALDGGLTHYRPSPSRPSVRCLGVQVDGRRTVTNFANLRDVETGRRVTIEYQAIDLKTLPDKRQFWYRLASSSGQTVLAGVTKDRRFDWLPNQRGAYTFEVQAIDRDLNYSDPFRLTFRATVPWHANAWIIVPGGGAVAGLLVWAFVARALYLRKSREAAVLRERVRIARDLHDHLGAGLTDLALAGDLVRQQIDQSGTAQLLAARLSASARELTRTMGEVIWMTDPEKDTLRSFISFVSSYAERFFAGSTLRLRFEFPAEFPEVNLPAELRNSLFMVAKEALNNVAKHAQASELRIKLELRDLQLHLSFEDDGQGFVMNQVAPERHGLMNMQQRLRDLGGQLQIESAVGQGTRVEARLPLPKK